MTVKSMMHYVLRSLIPYFVLIFSIVASWKVVAVEIPDFYQITIAVPDQTVDVRKQAIAEAYQSMIIKLAGSPRPLFNESIQKQQAKAESMVTSLRYIPTGDGALDLQLQFSETALSNVLVTAGEAVWGSNRPSLGIWIVESTASGKHFVSEGRSPLLSAFTEAFTYSGLPAYFPTKNITNELSVSIDDTWYLNSRLLAANDRWNKEGILYGRIDRQGMNTTVVLRLSESNNETSIQFQDLSGDANLIARKVAESAANTLAERYAVRYQTSVEGAAIAQTIAITNIPSFERYRQLLAYLENQLSVRSVNVVKVEGNRITLNIDLTTSWETAWRVLNAEGRLVKQVSSARTTAEPSITMNPIGNSPDINVQNAEVVQAAVPVDEYIFR